MNTINFPTVAFSNGILSGENVIKKVTTKNDLKGIFQDEQAFQLMKDNEIIYEVRSHYYEKEGKEGGLFFGVTYINPGKIGKEFFMTKGHFHSKKDRAEYYWGIEGEGILLMMDENSTVWAEKIFPGSLHYIKGGIAHRVANTGNKILSFAACWPSDAGHSYEPIVKKGFSVRLIEENNTPILINV